MHTLSYTCIDSETHIQTETPIVKKNACFSYTSRNEIYILMKVISLRSENNVILQN